ncbi:hypothetical protein [Orlajensenia flava]|uniref:hypothetical protein n=1 Tax=Orlajensenia flava TaxID=2565934 RepID=UPI0014554C9D|nr:hypothetical protein [Glaciibacter flavus]
MTTPRALPPGLRGRAFGVAEADAAGVSRERLRRADLRRLFHGSRAPSKGELTLLRRCLTYASRMPQPQVFSHATAAGIHQLRLPAHLQKHLVLHVSSVAPMRAPRVVGVVGHQLTPGAVRVVIHSGLRVVDAIDTWCQLAAVLSVRELVVVGDGLVCRKEPVATMDLLRQRVHVWSRRRGYRRLELALALIRPGTDSATETELRLDLVEAGLPEPHVNVAIRAADGRFLALGDLVYPEYRVVTEYDGDHHRTADDQYFHDIDRHDDVMEAGWRSIRVNKSHRGDRRRLIVQKVRRALVERGWTP